MTHTMSFAFGSRRRYFLPLGLGRIPIGHGFQKTRLSLLLGVLMALLDKAGRTQASVFATKEKLSHRLRKLRGGLLVNAIYLK
jgi:hypothetical protein